LKSGAGRVCVSFMGIAGDSAVDNPIPYFTGSDATFARLTESAEMYRNAMTNRIVLRGPTRRTLSPLTHGCSYCMAADNTRMLPPFLPEQRGEELVFSALVNRCIPAALFGSIPRAIVHQPIEPRTYPPGLAVARAGRLVASTTLAKVIEGLQVGAVSDSGRLRMVGRHLEELKLLDYPAFRAHVKSAVLPGLLSQLHGLSRNAHRGRENSSEWGRDISAMADGYLRSLNDRDHSVPLDLDKSVGTEEARKRFQALVGDMGRLLQAWHDIRTAAEALHAKGETACPAIKGD